MQDENIMKMAERADTEIRDIPTLNILLCYLLYKIDRPVSPDQLYDIAIGTGIINYFYYQDSIGYLLKNGHITAEKDDKGEDCYVLQPKGRECAKQLKNYAPKSYRDKLVLAGGVAANSCLRAELEKACAENGIKLYMPPMILCTDNAAMIGCAAYYEFMNGAEDDTMTLDAYPNAEL